MLKMERDNVRTVEWTNGLHTIHKGARKWRTRLVPQHLCLRSKDVVNMDTSTDPGHEGKHWWCLKYLREQSHAYKMSKFSLARINRISSWWDETVSTNEVSAKRDQLSFLSACAWHKITNRNKKGSRNCRQSWKTFI